MKTTVFIVACVLMATVTFAQNQEINEIKVTAPKFQSELYHSANDFLSNHVEYPQETKNAGLQGTEVVRFTVNTDGSIEGYTVVNSVSPECDREVMRILEATNGKWKAGTTNGNPAEMETEVSVVFCQGSVKNMVATAKNYQKKGNKWLMEKNNPQKAVQYYNRAIVLLPNEESLLAMRSICYFQLGDENQAFADCERIKYLVQKNGNVDVFENLAHINQNTAGYNELVETLKH